MQTKQDDTPIFNALQEYISKRVVRFDVPGHKGGRGNTELTRFLGKNCLLADINSMKPLDNLLNPKSVIRESEKLVAEAFGAENAFFIVNGTTAAVQAMIMYACKAGDEIILPRNVHKSVINALVLCGAKPVYVEPGINKTFGIPLGMPIERLEKTIHEHPNAKAILVNNPTYYGVCSDLRKITELAHRNKMLVLVDEAHGTHFYFGDNLPDAAMRVGADLSAVSMHKTGGSLTQSSFLLTSRGIKDMRIDANYLRQILSLTQTTSASYLLLTSLELARKNMTLNGRDIFKRTYELAEMARRKITKIGGYHVFEKKTFSNDKDVFDFDPIKLSIYTREIGLAGREVYDILRDEFNIQIEFGDVCNILAILVAEDNESDSCAMHDVNKLILALSEIKAKYKITPSNVPKCEYIHPDVVMTPQEAFYKRKTNKKLENSVGEVCGEFLVCYPPGIPILSPGEIITNEILEYIGYAKEKKFELTGFADTNIENVNVVDI